MLLREARDNLASMARRLESLGHLDSGSLVRLLRGTDIFLHPSRQETFCLSVFEAALAGCRIVARDIGGVPEAIHLATLLRSQLSLPPAGVHLAPPGAQAQGEPDRLVLALEEALAASTSAVVDASMAAPVLTTKSAAKYSSGTGRRSSPATRSGLLREFSWLGRLDKLLNGQSDRPLPEMTKPEKVEAS
jgi:glycosyltransferase involved in cell wall biosynthesis